MNYRNIRGLALSFGDWLNRRGACPRHFKKAIVIVILKNVIVNVNVIVINMLHAPVRGCVSNTIKPTL